SEEAQEAKDLRKRLEVVDEEDDDVFIEATPLARKVLLHNYGRFTSPPGRKFIDGMVVTVDPRITNSKLTLSEWEEEKEILRVGLVVCPQDHVGVDFIIVNASLSEMMNHVITNYTSESEDDKRDVTQNDYTFDQMVEWAKQEHFEDEEIKELQRQHLKNRMELEDEATLANNLLCNLTCYFEQMRCREIQITMLQNMPTMSLNSYRLHALLMTHEADIRTTNNSIRARQELLRSIAENQNFINSYRVI
nr:oligopeptide transporter [Tanacetum cinerariifolium]